MKCRSIKVRDFRNIKEADVSFSDGVNVLYGENAEGKTNLLEAVYYTAIGKSFRGQSNSEIIRFGEEYASISLDYEGKGRDQNITVRLHRGKTRSVEHNRVPVTKMSELVGEFRAVLFSPEHLSLVKSGPAERRQFLDIAISGEEPVYLRALQRYHHILKQRNALLKDAKDYENEFPAMIEVWSRQLAAEASVIADYRAQYIERAEGFVRSCFLEMMNEREEPTLRYMGIGKDDLSLYRDRARYEETLYRLLTQNLSREVAVGATLFGTHKDDMEIELNGRSARNFCSQGQQRSLSLALKLAEGEICRENGGEYPVFLFDDVLSELDGGRREYLLFKMREKQVIMTTCERALVPHGARILVRNGTYEKETNAENE